MTDAEFEEIWERGKEKDRKEIFAYLDYWNSLSLAEKEEEVIKSETCYCWEDYTSEEDDSDDNYYPEQLEYMKEYKQILIGLKKEGHL